MNKYNIYVFGDDGIVGELEVDNLNLSTIFSVRELTDIEKRKDTVTQSFIITGTPSNNLIFGWLGNMSANHATSGTQSLGNNFIRNKEIDVIIHENSREILKGKLIVEKIITKNNIVNYYCSVVGYSVAFFKKINDKYLHDLNLGNVTYTWNIAGIKDSWLPNSTLPFVYPTIDYGVDTRTGTFNTFDNSYDILNYRPAIKLTTYLNTIFENKLKYDTINNDIKNIIIPHNAEKLASNVSGMWGLGTFPTHTRSVYLPILIFSANSQSVINWNLSSSSYLSHYEIPTLSIHNTNQNYIQTGIKVLKLKPKNVNTKLRIEARITLGSKFYGNFHCGLVNINDMDTSTTHTAQEFLKNMTHKVVINKTAGAVLTTNINKEFNDAKLSGDFIFCVIDDSFKIIDYGGNLNNLDQITCENLQITFGGGINDQTKLDFQYGQTFKLEEMIPVDIKITDFLKSIMLMFNLYLIYDKVDDSFELLSYNDYYNVDNTNALDWSKKIDWGNFEIENNIKIPKSFKFSFTPDDDMMNDFFNKNNNKNYGSRLVNNNNGTYDESEIEVIFSPSINLVTSLDDKDIPIFYDSDDFMMGEKKPKATKLRLLYGLGIVTTSQYQKHLNGIDYDIYTGQYYKASMIDVSNNKSLLFDLSTSYSNDITNDDGITLYKKYHEKQLIELNDNNIFIMKLKAHLTDIDIQSIDLRLPIYISNDNSNGFFRIIEINYTNSDNLSDLILQKIN